MANGQSLNISEILLITGNIPLYWKSYKFCQFVQSIGLPFAVGLLWFWLHHLSSTTLAHLGFTQRLLFCLPPAHEMRWIRWCCLTVIFILFSNPLATIPFFIARKDRWHALVAEVVDFHSVCTIFYQKSSDNTNTISYQKNEMYENRLIILIRRLDVFQLWI